jgi:MFS family permease
MSGSNKRLGVNSVPALVAIVGATIVIVGDLTASLSVPGYSPIRDSVSSFAWTSLGWLQTICFLAMGLLLEIFVAGLFFNLHRARAFYAGIVLLALCGFVLMLIAAFHMEHTGAPPINGTIHMIASYGLGLLFPIALFSLAPSFKSTPGWKGIFIYTLIAGILGLGLIMGAIFGHQRGWFGLYERIIILNALVWVEAAAIHYLRLLLKRELKPQDWRTPQTEGNHE